MGKKCKNDKFYTKTTVVEELIKLINFQKYDCVIEPSAGAGAFSKNILHKQLISMDLEPDDISIQKQDWFTYKVPTDLKKVLVIGNPPFGVNNNLSVNFIKHALSFENISTIAFVLPNVFNKHTKQKIFPNNWKLVRALPLPFNSFLLNDKEYHVPCTFYIWTKEDSIKDLRFDSQKYQTHPDFQIITSQDKINQADFYVMGANPATIKNIQDVSVNNRGYYIKSLIDIEELKNNFKSINWAKLGNSSASGGVSWFSKYELNYFYDENKPC
jgi:hypothetical protein